MRFIEPLIIEISKLIASVHPVASTRSSLLARAVQRKQKHAADEAKAARYQARFQMLKLQDENRLLEQRRLFHSDKVVLLNQAIRENNEQIAIYERLSN